MSTVRTAAIVAEIERATKSARDRRDIPPRFSEATLIGAFFSGMFLGAVLVYGAMA